MGCARCHDHKYDPVSQKDYYRLFAYFNNVPEWGVGPNNGNSPPFVQVPASWPHLSPEENRFCVPEPVQLRNARTEMGNGLKRPQPGGADTVMVMHEFAEAAADLFAASAASTTCPTSPSGCRRACRRRSLRRKASSRGIGWSWPSGWFVPTIRCWPA